MKTQRVSRALARIGGVTFAAAAFTAPLAAQVDLDLDGLSDVYQLYYEIEDPDADGDGDGMSARDEGAAGTDPHDSMDVMRVASFERLADSVRLTLPTKPGKAYRAQFCEALGEEASWLPIGPVFFGDGTVMMEEITLQLPTFQTGAIRYDTFESLGSGSGVAKLANDPDFPDNPDSSVDLSAFDAPNNVGDGYGGRIYGYLVPSVTGSYVFHITSDDNGELWLSPDSDPGNMVSIASVPGWAGVGDYDKYAEQQSAPVELVAGQGYWIEARFQEGGGGDHLEVAWTLPGQSTIEVIPGENLAVPELGSGEDLSGVAQLFFRVAVSDLDSDGDGLTDEDERLLGLNPVEKDSDNDGIEDGVWASSALQSADVVEIEATLPRIPEVALGGAGEFTLRRTGGFGRVRVQLNIGGTATNGSDYMTLSPMVEIPFGANAAPVPVVPMGDGDETEGTETVVLDVNGDPEYQLGGAVQATVEIEDSPPPTDPFVAKLRPIQNGTSSAAGTGVLSLGFFGDQATIDLNFFGLSSEQVSTTLYLDDGGGPVAVHSMPLNQVEDYVWAFTATGGFTVPQIAQAIEDGELLICVESSAFPGGEICGYFELANGSLVPPVPPAPPALPGGPVTAEDAARLLTQATFGPTMDEIAHVQSIGIEAWIDEQFATPPVSHRQLFIDDEGQFRNGRQEAWWKNVVESDAQLIERVAFALSEIFVISDEGELQNYPEPLAHYYDLLVAGATGNFRQLLEDVTLNPMMGNYLDMRKNEKPNPVTGSQPDENYAREILQLFSIGLWKRHQDFSFVFDQYGQPVPTYGQSEVVGFAHTFTGWNFNNPDPNNASWNYPPANNYDPMSLWDAYHDTDEKLLLDGFVLPAGQDGLTDLEMALDLIFEHPNVGPFICRQLIQRLVTSNPSPGYVHRVAGVFNDNGSGVRGDMKAVVKAILTDHEARSTSFLDDLGYGKVREPLLKATALFRAFEARPQQPINPSDPQRDRLVWRYWNPQNDFGQAALRSPSVFNFFEPDYRFPGDIDDAGLFAPELQIASETINVRTANRLWSLLQSKGFGGTNREHVRWEWPAELVALMTNDATVTADQVLDWFDLVFLSGQMPSDMRGDLETLVADLYPLDPADAGDQDELFENLLYCLLNSPEFGVQK